MMAILDGKNLRGSIGNLSFSKNGKNTIVKSKPGKGNVKQTEATKKCASVFGTYISPLSKFIRWAFRDLVTGFYDGAMVNRMNSDLSTILYGAIAQDGGFDLNEESFERLIGFNFNISSVLNKSLLIKPVVKFSPEGLVVIIPGSSASRALRYPPKYGLCTLEIQVVQFNLDMGRWVVYPLESINVVQRELMAEKTFQYPFPPGSLCLVGIRTLYTDPFKGTLNNKVFNPAAIVAAHFNPTNSTEPELKNWNTIPIKMKFNSQTF